MTSPLPGTQIQNSNPPVRRVVATRQCRCSNSSVYLQVNGQTHCIRRLTAAEINANNRAAISKTSAVMQRQMESNKMFSLRLSDQMACDLDAIGENITKS
jgi:hypothetical protein